MTTAAEQYRALVAKLEEINDPRSQEERDQQMANFKGAYKDWEDAEDKKYSDAMKTFGQQFTATNPAAATPSKDVKKIQTLLNAKGAKLAVDGRLGPQTLAAIVKHLESEPAQQPAQAAQPAQQSTAAPRQPFSVPTGSSAKDTVQSMVGGALDPWSKGGLFNR